MQRRAVFVFAALCGLLSPSLALSADPPKGFRTFAWGAAPNATLKKFSGPTSDGLTMYKRADSAKKPPELLGVPVNDELYIFDRGKFYNGQAFLKGRDNFVKMKAALFNAYGKPTFANDEREIYKWKWTSQRIEIQFYYQAKFEATTVGFSRD